MNETREESGQLRSWLYALAAFGLIIQGARASGGGAAPPPAPEDGAKKTRACCTLGAVNQEAASAGIRESVEVPDLALVRQDGARVRLRDELKCGKPVMLNFVFTSCTTICPVMAATFAQVQERLGIDRDRVRLISVSIDPEYDTPARLREFARQHGAGPEWHFLTGSAVDIETVQKAFGAYRGSKFNHAALTFVRGENDEQWVRIEGLRSAGELESEFRRVAEK